MTVRTGTPASWAARSADALATFEITLHKTLAAVERGRDKLRGQSEFDEEFADDGGPIPD